MAVADASARAREADASGFALSDDGLRLYYEVHGGGGTTVVLLPPAPISHAGLWKAQVHHLARRFRVVLYDGRGNGRSDHPDASGPWRDRWTTDDCLAVMDATGTATAVLVGICGDGVWPSLQIAAAHPERVHGVFAIAPGVPLLTPPLPFRAAAVATFEDEIDDPVGWQKHNRRHILRDHADFLAFFFREMFPEPHSEKQIEDAVAFGLDSTPQLLVMDYAEPVAATREAVEAICLRVRCPVVVVQGDVDNCQPYDRGLAVAELTGAEHVRLEGAGHIPQARHPVVVNRLLGEFASRFDEPRPQRRTWVAGARRSHRALVVCSPIGLGHAWRDVAIARALRRARPGLELHWLAQPPVTTLLEACGETIHPASAELASEARAVDGECGEHALHAFRMLRRLDEVFCANFMVFHDLVREEPFDLWIADEAWEVDYFLHENPELKTAPYVWLTDFVGVLPMPGADEREAFLTADWNAQMVEHVARVPRLRDRAIFVGDPGDVVAGSLGPGLPAIRRWTRDRFAFSGYVTGSGPEEIVDRAALREELGFAPDETVCIVSAGGSAVGGPLLRRAAAAYPLARERLPGLRMILVGGPRIDPADLPADGGVEVRGYVHGLHRLLAACDVAISHGGLATTMELTAARRPFLFFPLAGHFEQHHHVAHRLARHRAGRRMRFDAAGPEAIAAALVEAVGAPTRYRAVPAGGAERAAALIAPLL